MNVLVFADNTNGSMAKAAFEAVSYGAKIASDTGGTSSVSLLETQVASP